MGKREEQVWEKKGKRLKRAGHQWTDQCSFPHPIKFLSKSFLGGWVSILSALGTGKSQPAVRVQQSVPATGVGLQPQGLVCPGACSWGDWDPEAANGQTGWLSPAAGGIHIGVHINICVRMYSQQRTCILLSQREKQDEAVGAVCPRVSALRVCDVCSRPCIYAVSIGTLWAYDCWEHTLTAGWTWALGAAAASPLSGWWICHDMFSSNRVKDILTQSNYHIDLGSGAMTKNNKKIRSH